LMGVLMAAMSLGQSTALAPDAGKAKVAASKVFEAIDTVPVIDAYSEEGEKLESVKGELIFDKLIFSYPTRPDAVVLNGFDLKIKSGQVVAFVGASGCGKSTVIQLIERFYDPSNGSIKLDGHDITNLNLKWYRSHMALVGQEPVLFKGTIFENIAYGKKGATKEEVEQAAKDSNAYDFIMQFPQKFDTDVGERGAKMSGGQKQRIAIARAIVRNPKILLLDEATSALDTKSEKVVQKALDKVKQGRTTIIVAHRLSTIKNANIIVVLKNGGICEKGTHDDLIKLEGEYYRLHKEQSKIPQPDAEVEEGELSSKSEEKSVEEKSKEEKSEDHNSVEESNE